MTTISLDSLRRRAKVYLVGGGPGDPELLTPKALRCLQSKSASTPAMVVANGTTHLQRTVTATLATIADAAADLPSPALVVIGDVVALRDQLATPEPQSSLTARYR